jgi:hypothetical protein
MVLTSIVAGCELIVGVRLSCIIEDVFNDRFGKDAIVTASTYYKLTICELVQHH